MDITEMILEQHNEQRRLFASIQEIDGGDRDALAAIWTRLRGFLEAHAEGEEQFFYPPLLKRGTGAADADDAEDETLDAIKDHNEIRDAAAGVQNHTVGSPEWFDAVAEADVKNSRHMAEEERQGLADFRANASVEERHDLGVKFLAFVSRNYGGVEPVDKDPRQFVREHS